MDPRPSLVAAAYPKAADAAELMVMVSDRLGIDPAWLANVIHFESAWNPGAKNRLSGATGLIQFMPSTAKRLGTSTDALSGMNSSQQLGYVYAYLAPYAGRMNSQIDVYMAVFYPKAIGQPDYRFPEQVVRWNPGILTPRHYATKAQAQAKLQDAIGRAPAEAARLVQRGGGVALREARSPATVLLGSLGAVGFLLVALAAWRTRRLHSPKGIG